MNLIKSNSERLELLNGVFLHYKIAKEIWTSLINNDYMTMFSLIEEFYWNEGLRELLGSQFAEIKVEVMTNQIARKYGGGKSYSAEYKLAKTMAQEAQQIIWIRASKRLKLYEQMNMLSDTVLKINSGLKKNN